MEQPAFFLDTILHMISNWIISTGVGILQSFVFFYYYYYISDVLACSVCNAKANKKKRNHHFRHCFANLLLPAPAFRYPRGLTSCSTGHNQHFARTTTTTTTKAGRSSRRRRVYIPYRLPSFVFSVSVFISGERRRRRRRGEERQHNFEGSFSFINNR